MFRVRFKVREDLGTFEPAPVEPPNLSNPSNL